MAVHHFTDTKPEGAPILKPGTQAREKVFIAQKFAREANRRIEAVAAILTLLERAAESEGHVTAEVARRVLFLLEEQTGEIVSLNSCSPGQSMRECL